MTIDFHRDGPWELPEGWVWAHAKEFARVVGGATPSNAEDQTNFEATGIPWITPADLSKYAGAHISRGARSLSKKGFENSSARLMPPGTLLISSRAPVGYAVVSTNEVCTNQGFKSLVFKIEMCPEFFRYYVILNRKYFIDNASGTTFKELSGKTMAELLFPVAPIEEQRRIVARIDELFTDIVDGETALTRAGDDLDTWRRSLLKAAVTGELTREWREHNKPNETGKDVLTRIATAKQSFKRSKSNGRRFVQDEAFDDRLIDLPKGWEWSSLGAIGEVVGGVTVDKKRRPNNPVTVPYLRVANVQRGYLDLSEIKSITVERSVAEALALKKGDILLNEGGDRDKIGRGWVWDGQIEGCIHQNHVFRVRPYDAAINPYFVSHFANEMGRRFFVEKGKQTTNLASISMSKISQLPIPIVPAAELQEAMRILDEALLATIDVEAELTAASVSVAARQSILKAAFEGRLVKQDPRDEPAEILLARLDQSAPISIPQPSRRGRRARRPAAGAEA